MVEHPKPHPDMIHYIIEKLGGSKERTLLIGDTDNDLLAARAAGIPSCLVGWGYSADLEALKKLATFYVVKPDDLIHLLKHEEVVKK